MRLEPVRNSTALLMGSSLSALYAAFLYYAGERDLLLPSGLMGQVVMLVEALKVVLLFAVPRLRNGSWQLVYPFVTAEVAVTPVAYALLFAFHVPGPGALVAQFIEVYLASEAILTPPYTTYRLVSHMTRGGDAGHALELAVMQFGLVSYVLEVSSFSASISPGLEGLGASMIPSATVLTLPSTYSPLYALVGLAGGAFFVSMLVYASADQEALEFRPMVVILTAASTFATAALFLVPGILGDASLTLSAATFVVLLAVWGMAHG